MSMWGHGGYPGAAATLDANLGTFFVANSFISIVHNTKITQSSLDGNQVPRTLRQCGKVHVRTKSVRKAVLGSMSMREHKVTRHTKANADTDMQILILLAPRRRQALGRSIEHKARPTLWPKSARLSCFEHVNTSFLCFSCDVQL
jgi:hypothetical protein